MSAERFEDRLLAELKGYVGERTGQAAAPQEGRRAGPRRRSTWRLASGGLSVAAAIAVAAVVANVGSATGSAPASKAPAIATTASGPLFHTRNAAFAIDAEPSGVVDITILKGDEEPDIAALRSDLARAGVRASVVTNVPTCELLAQRPGAPSPVGSAQSDTVTDAADRPISINSDFVYQVDASADTRGTTLWIMFSSTLSTIFVERTVDSGPQPNCLANPTGNQQ